MASFPDLDWHLTGPAAELRLAAERDIPEVLIAHQDDAQLYVRLGLERPPSGAELGRRVEESSADRAAGVAVWLTILSPGSDECCGQVDVHEVDWDHRRAQLGIWVAPAQRRHGRGAEALRLAGRWLLGACGLERVELLTEPSNAPMRHAARRAGFQEEGVLRGYLRERGRRVDVVVISLISADRAATE